MGSIGSVRRWCLLDCTLLILSNVKLHCPFEGDKPPAARRLRRLNLIRNVTAIPVIFKLCGNLFEFGGDQDAPYLRESTHLRRDGRI
jgi:hypothetical protein